MTFAPSCPQNNVLELWSLFDFLMPGFLGTERQFAARYGKPILASRDAKSSSREQEAGVLLFCLMFLINLCVRGSDGFLLIRSPGHGSLASTGVAFPSEEDEGGCAAGSSS